MWAPLLAILSSSRFQKSVDTTKQGWSATKHSYDWLLNGAIGILKAALVVFGVIIVARVINSQLADGYLLTPVTVSNVLSQEGYTPSVTTALLTEQIVRFQEEAMRDSDIIALKSVKGLRRAEQAAIDIPGVGVKLDEFVALMGQALPFGPRRVTVSVVSAPKELTATVRIDGRPMKLFRQAKINTKEQADGWGDGCTQKAINCLVRQVALYISSVTDPVITGLKLKLDNDAEGLAELLKGYRKHERRHGDNYQATVETLFAFQELVGAVASNDPTLSNTENANAKLQHRHNAQRFFRNALEGSPNDVLLLRMMADNARHIGGEQQERQADCFFQRALQRSPNNERLRVRWMFHLASTGRLQQAAQQFNYLRKHIGSGSLTLSQLFLAWGDALRERTPSSSEGIVRQQLASDLDCNDALEPACYYELALAADPASPMLFASMGTWQVQVARHSKGAERTRAWRAAIGHFEGAIRSSRGALPSWVHANMAVAFSKLRKPAAAIAQFEQAAAVGPQQWARKEWLRELEKNNQPEELRMSSIRRFIRYYPQQADGHELYLRELVQQQLAELAGNAKTNAQQPSAKPAAASSGKPATLESIVAEFDKKLHSSLEAIQQTTAEAALLTSVARAFRRNGKPELALKYIQQALAYDDYYYSAFIEQAEAHVALDQHRLAERVLGLSSSKLKSAPSEKRLNPLDAAGHYFAAGRVLMKHNPAVGIQHLDRAMNENCYSGWIVLHKSMALLNSNSPEKLTEAVALLEHEVPFIRSSDGPAQPVNNVQCMSKDANGVKENRPIWNGTVVRAGGYFRYGLALLAQGLCSSKSERYYLAKAASMVDQAIDVNKGTTRPLDQQYLQYAIVANVLAKRPGQVAALQELVQGLTAVNSSLQKLQDLVDKNPDTLPSFQQLTAAKLLEKPSWCASGG